MVDNAKAFLRVVSEPGKERLPLNEREFRAFPDDLAARWLRACRKLADAGYGEGVVMAYRQHSLAVAELICPEAALDMADTVSVVSIKAGRQAASTLPWAATKAAAKFTDEPRFRSWLNLMQRAAALAPESASLVFDRMESLLSHLNVSRLEAWLLAGVRAAGGDAERRRRFFSMEDPEAERWLQREAGEIAFADVERRLKAYLTALWKLRVPIREPSLRSPGQSRRRSSFDRGLVRIPATYPGYRGAQTEDVFRAALAHVAAHLIYSTEKFPVRNLKPIQIVLVSLIEDARVEHLAMREYPGLRRLWLPFHIAQSGGALTAPSLLARLARALIDPDFHDIDGWVEKGKAMFFQLEANWADAAISRKIGDLLGNDLGQLRIQFNPRTYVVEPPYRDDNMGIWDFGDQQSSEMDDAELLFESVCIEQQEKDATTPPDRERPEEEKPEDGANRAALSPVPYEEEGLPVARYPEYDYVTGHERPEWTTLVEYQPTPGPTYVVREILDRRRDVVNRLTKLIRSARVSRPQRMKRQAEGDALDFDACVEAVISRHNGDTPDPRVYATTKRRFRDLSVLLLLDISESTKDRIKNSSSSVLDIEREAAVLFAHAMSELFDPFAIAAFCSNKREDVHYLRIKDFDAPYDGLAQSYLAGLTGGLSTRIGPAMRHAGADLRKRLTHRRLLLVVTDGEPSDTDVSDRKYLVEDARRAAISLGNDGIDVFCVGLGSGDDGYLARIFGRRNFVQIDRVERLPERLPMLYLRLTA
jgi:hypothetical protein